MCINSILYIYIYVYTVIGPHRVFEYSRGMRYILIQLYTTITTTTIITATVTFTVTIITVTADAIYTINCVIIVPYRVIDNKIQYYYWW